MGVKTERPNWFISQRNWVQEEKTIPLFWMSDAQVGIFTFVGELIVLQCNNTFCVEPTGWPNEFIICPILGDLEQWKIARNNKNCPSWFNILPYTKYVVKNCPKLLKFCQSIEFWPNLVSLFSNSTILRPPKIRP